MFLKNMVRAILTIQSSSLIAPNIMDPLQNVKYSLCFDLYRFGMISLTLNILDYKLELNILTKKLSKISGSGWALRQRVKR